MSVLFIYAAFNAVLIFMGVRYAMQAPRITTIYCDGCGMWVEDVMHLYCEPCAMCGMVAEFNTNVPTRDEVGSLYCTYCIQDVCQELGGTDNDNYDPKLLTINTYPNDMSDVDVDDIITQAYSDYYRS